MNLMERRLLTLLADAAPADRQRRESLEETLRTVRRSRDQAVAELRISPSAFGAALRLNQSFHPEPTATALNPERESHAAELRPEELEQEETEATEDGTRAPCQTLGIQE